MNVRALDRITLLVVVSCSMSAPLLAQSPVAQAPADESRPAVPALERPAKLEVELLPLGTALTRLSKTSGVGIAFSPSIMEQEQGTVSCSCMAMSVRHALQELLNATAFSYSEFNGQVVVFRALDDATDNTRQQRAPTSRLAMMTSALGDGLPLMNTALTGLWWSSWFTPGAASSGELDKERKKSRKQEGAVTGRVTDAATGAVLSGVSIVIEGTPRGAVTDARGRYRIGGLAAGPQRVSAVSIGYKKLTRAVEVQTGVTETADFALAADAVALDQLVVTGNMTKARIRELSAPISVVNSREIEQKQIQRIDQLFRGTIPGASAWDMGPYNYYSEISVRGKNSLYFDYIKTYIDGVEVASPLMLATIDPNQIERVEVIRGPQASTLYGSDAAGGVLQIFTKKGTPGVARPQISAKASVGIIETDYMDDNPTTQEHSLAISGGGQDFSYNFGGTYLTVGEYVPEAYTDNTSVFGSARASQGALTAEISGRYYAKHFGWPLNPVLRAAGYAFYSVPREETHNIRQSTFGLNLGYQVRPNWQHNVSIGIDRSQFDDYGNKPRLTTPADTFVFINNNESSRASIRYNTSLDLTLSRAVTATLTGGVDYSAVTSNGFFTDRALRNIGSLGAATAQLNRLDYNNTGYFVQGKLGVSEALFLTAGVRVEKNENFGDDYGDAVAPRVGVAYSRSLREGIDMKLRGSWGKGIRAPQPFHKQENITPSARIIANPDIGPEEQKGWDAGVEFYFGKRATFAVTYYDQKAINLIDNVFLQPGPPPTIQYQNVGEMANSGWEFEGTLNLAPVRLTGTFSTTSSTVEKLAQNYLGDLQVGDRNLKIPEQQAGLSVAYDFLRGNVALDMTYIGSFVNTDWVALYGFYFGGDPYRGSGRAYWQDYDAVTRFSLRTEQAVTSGISAFLRIENLTGDQLGERDNTQVTAGRMTVFGVRVVR